ncbi:MAG: methyltransferase domain-containing protein [Bdellovibrionia bacterium]
MNQRSQSYTLWDSKTLIAEELRLRLQAEKLFKYEKDSLASHGLKDGQTIVDLGCGNGFFLSLIGNAFPNCSLYGADRNSKLLERAQEFCPNAQFITLDLGNVEELKHKVKEIAPDFVYLRYVLQHMNVAEVSHLMRALSEVVCHVLLIDGDDREITHLPANSSVQYLIQKKMERQATLGGDRTVGSRLSTILEEAGFTSVSETKLRFSSKEMGWESFRDILYPILRSGLPHDLEAPDAQRVKEAEDWYRNAFTDPSYTAWFGSIHVSGRADRE